MAAALAGAVVALTAPAAGAATKDVWGGAPGAKNPPGLPRQGEANAFFPQTVTVAAGDHVSFRSAGLHTITFPVLDEAPPAFTILRQNDPISGANDAAGAPFYFNGKQNFAVNPTILAPTADHTYDGRALRNSGVLIGPQSGSYDLQFTKPGVYNYFCVIHPGMVGRVKVRRAGSKVPSAAADRRTVKAEVRSWVADNKSDAKVRPPKGTVLAGSDHGTHVLQRFFPQRADVKAGGSLTFKLVNGTSEGHTITFGPKPYLDDLMAKYVLPTADFNPLGIYPSDRRPLLLTGANHGNGFLNSGLIDKDRVTPFGDNVTIRFARKGTYPYVCLLHPGMVGEVVVH